MDKQQWFSLNQGKLNRNGFGDGWWARSRVPFKCVGTEVLRDVYSLWEGLE